MGKKLASILKKKREDRIKPECILKQSCCNKTNLMLFTDWTLHFCTTSALHYNCKQQEKKKEEFK